MRTSAALLFAVFLAACADSTLEATGSTNDHLDTSGCSGTDRRADLGPVSILASTPPQANCWNVDESGLTVLYTWTQVNDGAPAHPMAGFYVSLNDAGTYDKATTVDCVSLPGGGLSHDTSGTHYYACTAEKRFDFAHTPALRSAAYGSGGARLPWRVQVAVSLDDNGHWDSLDGANYRATL